MYVRDKEDPLIEILELSIDKNDELRRVKVDFEYAINDPCKIFENDKEEKGLVGQSAEKFSLKNKNRSFVN